MSEEATNPMRDGNPGGNRRELRDPVHEGHARGSRVRLLGPHGRDPAGARHQVRGGRHPPRSDGSARSSRRSRTGRRSPSCSSTASWSAAATSSPRCTRSGELRADARARGASRPTRLPMEPRSRRRRCRSRTGSSSTAALRQGRAARAGQPAVRFADGALWALDQTLLPWREVELELRDAAAVAAAIKRLSIRGAPLIGVAAGIRSRARACPRPRRARARLPDPDRRPADGGQPRLRRGAACAARR